jgi:hypothetical protein
MNNNPFHSLFLRVKSLIFLRHNGLYIFNKYKIDINLALRKNIYFDFSNPKYIHFGDMLFFIPLISWLSKNKKIVILVDKERFFFANFIFNQIAIVNIFNNATKLKDGSVLVTSPYNLFNYHSYHLCIVGLGCAYSSTTLKYPLFFAHNFVNNFASLEIDLAEIEDSFFHWRALFKRRLSSQLNSLPSDYPSKILWLCPYIASGKFRDLFKSKLRKLIFFAVKEAFLLNTPLALIGGALDKNLDINGANYYDFRGKSIVDMMHYAISDNVRLGFGFDNFWMHFFDLIGKPYLVLFRGRFLSYDNNIHLNSVNVSFLYAHKRIYI